MPSLRTILLMTLLTMPAAFGAAPTTRPAPPTTPLGPIERPELIDAKQPAFVPKFAATGRPPGGQFAERNYAYKYGTPGFAWFGWCGYGGFGYGGGNWGSTTTINN